jgi:selenocysteine lyase/cysteine desulfurase
LPADPARIAFQQNATQALNTAIRGILRPGDVAVTTAFDHNAVLRPLDHLSQHRGVEVRMIPGAPDGTLDLHEAARILDGARLMAVNGASNVLGTRAPLEGLVGLARRSGALVLVDAAQWAGQIDESLADLGVDMVAFTGHKGLLGPQGIGGLWVRPGLRIEPTLFGGTGGQSANRSMPDTLPERLEAGTQNAPGMAGLLAGIEFLLDQGVAAIHASEMELKARLRAGLSEIPSVRVLSPPGVDGVGIVTMVSDAVDPATLAEMLDRGWGVMVQHGLNCAPEAHRVLGTLSTGAVRFSLGWASTAEDVETAVQAVAAIVTARNPAGHGRK